jgi:pimeloyl-ACP methyl ester carboxylesterase
LPGIMGSRLGLVSRRSYSLVWLHPTAVANGSLTQLAIPGPRALRAVGVMLPGYLKLRLRLEIAGFRPLFCPFDWRRDVDQLARSFARLIERSGERKALVVGHSMGGLVARAALAYDKRRIARLIQLGAPNDGSFAPLQALRAVYPTVRKIAAIDRTHTAEQLARAVYHTLPGIYQMLPSAATAADTDLFDPRSWPTDELSPDPKALARARKVRARLPAANDRCNVIIGVGQETIVSAVLRGRGFQYEYRAAGDGTVPLSRAKWNEAATWFVSENHGALTQNDLVLAAVADILKSGDTRRLRTTAPSALDVAPRTVTDDELRAIALRKVQWETLSLDSRRRILEPVLSPEFLAP